MGEFLSKDLGLVLKAARNDANLTQDAVAEKLNKPQSFVAKYESGERQIEALELIEICEALGITYTSVFNQVLGTDSILDEFEISEGNLTTLVNENPSLKGMLLGYLAEFKFHELYLNHFHITEASKDDDHDRSRKGDRRITYKGKEFVIEVKSLQTNSIKRLGEDEWTGGSQVDASDRRSVRLKDGSSFETTLLLRGEFDILAVNCFRFGDSWRYVFALNEELATSTFKKYPEEARGQLIASIQKVTWPPQEPFSSDFLEVLEKAYAKKYSS